LSAILALFVLEKFNTAALLPEFLVTQNRKIYLGSSVLS
jgi:hypothetical protein